MKKLFSESRPLLLAGCGKMGTALLQGWLGRGLKPGAVWIIDPAGATHLGGKVKTGHVVKTAESLPDDLRPRVVVLAVKPQIMPEVLPGLARFGEGEALFLSIAAGYRRRAMADELGANTPIIRAMPNTPASIGQGISAAVRSAGVGAEDHDLVEQLLAAVGEVVWVDAEGALDAVTALSGSGPAYVFHMVEAMAGAGVAVGLAPDLSLRLATQTVIGAGAMLAQPGADAAELRRNVTSPGGTTEAALAVLMDGEHGLARLVQRAIRAATQRSSELSGDN